MIRGAENVESASAALEKASAATAGGERPAFPYASTLVLVSGVFVLGLLVLAGGVALALGQWSGRFPLALAVTVSLLVGLIGSVSLIGPLVDYLWHFVRLSDERRYASKSGGKSVERGLGWLAKTIGATELGIFFFAFAIGQYAIAGAWLAMKTTGKVVAGWNQYADEPRHGRQVFNIFLIGTALSLINALGSYALAAWLSTGDPLRLLVTK